MCWSRYQRGCEDFAEFASIWADSVDEVRLASTQEWTAERRDTARVDDAAIVAEGAAIVESLGVEPWRVRT